MRDDDREAWEEQADDETESGDARALRTPSGERRRRWRPSPDVVTVLAILVPGLGHLALGRLRAAVLWLVAILLGYWAILLPGVVLHVLSIVSARRAAAAPASGAAERGLRANP